MTKYFTVTGKTDNFRRDSRDLKRKKEKENEEPVLLSMKHEQVRAPSLLNGP